MKIERYTNQDHLRTFLNSDAFEAAYALGDLAPDTWAVTRFWAAIRENGGIEGVVLTYHGFNPPSLTMHGDTNAVAEIMREIKLEPEVFYLAPASLQYVIGQFYDVSHLHELYRMVLSVDHFAKLKPDLPTRLHRLTPDDADAVNQLYSQAAEPGEAIVAFLPSQIAHGVFFGIEKYGKLVAAAGTHVASQQENIAAIGNVFTHPKHRGKGYGSAVTAAVAQGLIDSGINRITLNVKQGNSAAVRIYQKLGFHIYCNFIEGPGKKL